MHVAITFLFTSSFIILVVMTFGEDMIDSYSTLTNRWDTLNGEWEESSNTQIAVSPSQSDQMRVIIANIGRVPLEDFESCSSDQYISR